MLALRSRRGHAIEVTTTISLQPVRRNTPACTDYEDLESVVEYEREMRVHRAHTEPFRIELPATADQAWIVRGERGSSWLVDLVDASREHDTCTCPDFLTNELGTCKHLQAVYRAVSSKSRAASLCGRLGTTVSRPTITVDACGPARLEALGRFTETQLARLGVRQTKGGLVTVDDPNALISAKVRIVHAAVPIARTLLAQKATGKRASALARDLARGTVAADVVQVPLFAYQRDGVAHLATRGRALLADDMGLGKTVQAIAACELLRRRGEAARVLIVTPASLKDQWAREIARYAGERAVVIGGDSDTRKRAFESDAPYRIVNYELTWRELERIQALDADVMVLDEAQRAKNFRTKTASTLRELPSRFLFVLTGTPIENRLDDLYSLLQLVDPTVLGPLWRFNHQFHTQAKKGRVVGTKNLGELRTRLAPVVMRRRKDEVLSQLPALTEQTRYTAMTDVQLRLEQEHRAEAAKYMSIAEKRPLRPEEHKRLMGHLLKARQACNAVELCDPKRGKGSPKLDELEQLVSEIAEQGTAKVIVFSEWVEMLELAANRLDDMKVGFEMLHGSIPTERRPELLRRFREDADVRVLLSTDAGGVGLNLQEASYVVHLDLPWNPGKLDQRTSRAHRLGQTRGVTVTFLCAETGIERGIEGTLGSKRALRCAALDASSNVDAVEAVGFSVFLGQLRDAIAVVEQGMAEPLPPPELPSLEEAVAEPVAAIEPAPAPPAESAPVTQVSSPRSAERLRFARVVLDAGFAADAAAAAYDALASALSAAAGESRTLEHGALVARLYRDLVPRGMCPPPSAW